jgi:hypothetical protein
MPTEMFIGFVLLFVVLIVCMFFVLQEDYRHHRDAEEELNLLFQEENTNDRP